MQEGISTPQTSAAICTAGFEQRIIDHSPITPSAPACERELASPHYPYFGAVTLIPGQSLEGPVS